jgi:hypothetical protein
VRGKAVSLSIYNSSPAEVHRISLMIGILITNDNPYLVFVNKTCSILPGATQPQGIQGQPVRKDVCFICLFHKDIKLKLFE